MSPLTLIFFVVGTVAFLSSILLMVFPEAFLKISDLSNRVFLTDENAIKYRFGLGISLLIVSAFMFFSFYHLMKLYYH